MKDQRTFSNGERAIIPTWLTAVLFAGWLLLPFGCGAMGWFR